MILHEPWPQALYLSLVVDSSVVDPDLDLREERFLALLAFLSSAFFLLLLLFVQNKGDASPLGSTPRSATKAF